MDLSEEVTPINQQNNRRLSSSVLKYRHKIKKSSFDKSLGTSIKPIFENNPKP